MQISHRAKSLGTIQHWLLRRTNWWKHHCVHWALSTIMRVVGAARPAMAHRRNRCGGPGAGRSTCWHCPWGTCTRSTRCWPGPPPGTCWESSSYSADTSVGTSCPRCRPGPGTSRTPLHWSLRRKNRVAVWPRRKGVGTVCCAGHTCQGQLVPRRGDHGPSDANDNCGRVCDQPVCISVSLEAQRHASLTVGMVGCGIPLAVSISALVRVGYCSKLMPWPR
jgi:hypothetical protein